MQHSIHTAARRKRRQALKRLARRGAAVVAITVSGTTAAVGFSVAAADGSGPGTVLPTGEAKAFGSASGNAVTGMARTPTGDGYLLATNRGAVFAFGDAVFHGSLPAGTSSQIVDIAAAPDGQGYWLVGADGGIFNFGSAAFNGSAGATPLNQPIVGMAATPTGKGYWLVARDGGIFNFGDAAFLGSTGGTRLNQPIVGMAATPSGGGYWLVARDGGIFAFGDAAFQGSASGLRLNEPIVGMASTPSGGGYWLVARDGGIFTYGDAGFHGSLANAVTGPVVDVEGTPDGDGDVGDARRSLPRRLRAHVLRPAGADGVGRPGAPQRHRRRPPGDPARHRGVHRRRGHSHGHRHRRTHQGQPHRRVASLFGRMPRLRPPDDAGVRPDLMDRSVHRAIDKSG